MRINIIILFICQKIYIFETKLFYMKKSTKIILIILSVIIIAIGSIAYHIYQTVVGNHKLSGSVENIPSQISGIPEITKGEYDWPIWRGLNLDGKSLFNGIQTDWLNGLKELWQVNFLCQGVTTASWSSPVIQGNRLVVMGRDEENDLVFCLNTETGDLIWKQYYLAPTGTGHGPGPRATAVIDNDMVYTFGRAGDVVCWNLYDGKKIWKKNVEDIGGKEPQWGHSATPMVYNNKLIVQGGGSVRVIAFDKLTGDIIWTSLEGEAGYSASTTINLGASNYILIYHGTGLSCLNPENGKELWTVPWETKYYVNATTPIVNENFIFHTSAYGMGGQLIEVSETDYKVVWKNNVIAAQHSDQILIDGYLYGYTGDSNNRSPFKCVNFFTGEEMWSTKEIGGGTCMFIDNYLICLDGKGNLYLVKPKPEEFILAGKIKKAIPEVSALSWTLPVAANGKLYLRYMQTLICYDLKK